MSQPKAAAISYVVDAAALVGTTVYSLAADVPWAPLITLVLIPGARCVGEYLRHWISRPVLIAENERLRVKLADLEQRLFERDEEVTRLRSDRAKGPKEADRGPREQHARV